MQVCVMTRFDHYDLSQSDQETLADHLIYVLRKNIGDDFASARIASFALLYRNASTDETIPLMAIAMLDIFNENMINLRVRDFETFNEAQETLQRFTSELESTFGEEIEKTHSSSWVNPLLN